MKYQGGMVVSLNQGDCNNLLRSWDVVRDLQPRVGLKNLWKI